MNAHTNPAEICAAIERAPKIASSAANSVAKTIPPTLRAGKPHTDDGRNRPATQCEGAVVGTPSKQAAAMLSQPVGVAPPAWSSGHITLAPYDPAPIAETVDQIVYLHRRRQAAIRAKTKVILMQKAEIRSMLCSDADFEEDKTTERVTAFGKAPRKLTKAAQKRVDDSIKAALVEIEAGLPESEIAHVIFAYVQSERVFERQCEDYKKQMVKAVKRLPIYKWAQSVTGFGDVSLATIIGECGDIGTYKSISAVWKRLGLAVINGRRQGNPGEGASAQDWIDHGYNRSRRSVSFVAREHVIGGMGKWRPEMGSTLEDATYYQRVYAERARYEAEKLGLPITESDKGKESYKKHVAMRAHRYVEKRLLKHLYLEWRRAA